MSSHPDYPITLDLRAKRVLVVGAGPVAERRVAGLLAAGAVVEVVAPAATDTTITITSSEPGLAGPRSDRPRRRR